MNSDLLLERKEYRTEARRGWRGWRGWRGCERRVNVTSTIQPGGGKGQGGKALLKCLMPDVDKSQHDDLARQHAKAGKKNTRLWNLQFDRAMLRTFGRPFSIGDFKISGICREEFDDRTKSLLRKYAYNSGMHERLAVLHKMAAVTTHRKAVEFCRAEVM